MKRTTWMLAWTILPVLVVAAIGCSTTPKGPSDEEIIRGALGQLKTGLETGNIDQIMSIFSEQFRDPDMGDKARLRREIQSYYADGDLKNAKVSLETITLAKTDATTYNVDGIKLQANFGRGTLGFTMTKEADGAWRAVRVRFAESY